MCLLFLCRLALRSFFSVSVFGCYCLFASCCWDLVGWLVLMVGFGWLLFIMMMLLHAGELVVFVKFNAG